MVDWSDGFIAVDWGTTNRRAYRLDAAGNVTDQMADDLGILAVPAGGFEAGIAEIQRKLGDAPVLLAGMIGSNRGWHDARYVSVPTRPSDLRDRLLWVTEGQIAIVPGLCVVQGERADVMRGEEVQAFGLHELFGRSNDITIVHPGTHTKWVEMRDGAIIDFRTVMTGEMFAILRGNGILSTMLQGEVRIGEAFLEGVERGYEGSALTAELFSVRARVLLSLLDEEEAASFTSGLLIGADLGAGLIGRSSGEIAIVGGPGLTKLYRAAFDRCGFSAREVDGGDAFVAGMQAIKSIAY